MGTTTYNTNLKNFTIFDKQAQYNEELLRRESFSEVVDRYIDQFQEQFPRKFTSEFKEAKELIINNRILPSMRAMQFAGIAAQRNNSRIYNCSQLPIKDLSSFQEVCYNLLSGCGVGVSVQKEHVKLLPQIKRHPEKQEYIIEDTIEGWSDSIGTLIKSFYGLNPFPEFNFNKIRAKGSKLSTGGKAPGPEPLRKTLTEIEAVLRIKVDGDKLRPIEAHDIICHIAQAVLSGGVRRAALISLFSFEDQEMRVSKSGLNLDLNPQRYRANNSAVFYRPVITEKEFKEYLNNVLASGRGEPGLFLTNDVDVGTNPCGEISLNPYQYCNLNDINGQEVHSQKEFEEVIRFSTFLGTIQSTQTNFSYLREDWRKITEEERLLGIGITGIFNNPRLLNNSINLIEGARVAVEVNREFANKLHINRAARITTIKPSGSTSCVFDTSSGIHPAQAPQYIRRSQISKDKPLYKYLEKEHNNLVKDYHEDPKSSAVVEFACRAPQSSLTRNDVDAIQHLEFIKKFNLEWILPGHRYGKNTHNVSASVYYEDNEAEKVINWLYDNRDSYTGLTLFPKRDFKFSQAPFEEISKEEQEKRISKESIINFNEVVENVDDTQINQELACMGGSCEIDF